MTLARPITIRITGHILRKRNTVGYRLLSGNKMPVMTSKIGPNIYSALPRRFINNHTPRKTSNAGQNLVMRAMSNTSRFPSLVAECAATTDAERHIGNVGVVGTVAARIKASNYSFLSEIIARL